MYTTRIGDAATAFHQLAARRSSGKADSFQQDLDDQAVTYLLTRQQSRKAVPFLVHDVLRDARKFCVRSKARSQNFHARAVVNLKSPGISTPGCSGLDLDPADVCVASDLEHRIRTLVAELGPFARACLDGMIAERTVAEIAASTGAPIRTVERMRATVRTLVSTLLALDEAA